MKEIFFLLIIIFIFNLFLIFKLIPRKIKKFNKNIKNLIEKNLQLSNSDGLDPININCDSFNKKINNLELKVNNINFDNFNSNNYLSLNTEIKKKCSQADIIPNESNLLIKDNIKFNKKIYGKNQNQNYLTNDNVLKIKSDVNIENNLNIENGKIDSYYLENISDINVPVGTIVMWSNDVIPENWKLCDGKMYTVDGRETTNCDKAAIKTPDLRERFVLGYDSENYNLNSFDGEKEVTLIEENLPDHTHTLHDGKMTGSGVCGGDSHGNTRQKKKTKPKIIIKNVTGSFSEIDNPEPRNNMPPYIILKYIMKVKMETNSFKL